MQRKGRARADLMTSTAMLLLGLPVAVVEFERLLIVDRTQGELAFTRPQGKRLGRPPGSKDRKKRSKRGTFLRWTR